ncbi:SDR family NAD(P)-dependent oxidoreductase [Phytohabitans kaempferiae]|uniref:SDR family NAD(P)-dependent oxidoreductase n=1 Tax=Phytohabitans kaempferiae TaxID=1620943 RepID=A0ABV6LY01_9ACTN
MELEGRVAVVTGAASGIGRALAAALGEQGCRVVLADIEAAALDAAVAELRAAGRECIGVVTDVSDAASVEALAHRAEQAYGAVHVLCNNAGVSVRRPVAEQSIEDWSWVLGVDLWGVIHGLRTFLPVLTAQPEAHVVNIASVAGLVPFALGGPYNAAKAAVVAISETLYLELAELAPHVGVSVVCPGATRSNFNTSARNRPRHQDGASEQPDAGALARQKELSRALIEAGADPATIADQVLAAIRQRTFWVLTHRSEYGPAIRSRTERMLEGANPLPVDLAAILAAGS